MVFGIKRRRLSRALLAKERQAEVAKLKAYVAPSRRVDKIKSRIAEAKIKEADLNVRLKIAEANRAMTIGRFWPFKQITRRFWKWRIDRLTLRIGATQNTIAGLNNAVAAEIKLHGAKLAVQKTAISKLKLSAANQFAREKQVVSKYFTSVQRQLVSDVEDQIEVNARRLGISPKALNKQLAAVRTRLTGISTPDDIILKYGCYIEMMRNLNNGNDAQARAMLAALLK